jgi:hypothetical protein
LQLARPVWYTSSEILIERELPFKQGFGSWVRDTSTLLRRACAKLRLETTGAEGAFDGEKPKQAQGQTNGIVETDDMTTATHYQPERTRGGEQWRSLNWRNPKRRDRKEPQRKMRPRRNWKDGIAERNEVELTAWNCGGDLGYDPLGIATVFSILRPHEKKYFVSLVVLI